MRHKVIIHYGSPDIPADIEASMSDKRELAIAVATALLIEGATVAIFLAMTLMWMAAYAKAL